MNATKRPSPTNLDRIAQAVTVGFAVLTGICSVWAGAGLPGSNQAESAANVFVAITAVGGVAMGLLYLRRRLAAL